MELKAVLKNLLSSVSSEKRIVVESGYGGTFPMMLAALDIRVSFRMYTTAPYLYETYKDIIFCRRYEDIRKFETLYSQEYLMRYSSFKNGEFYVNIADSTNVTDTSLAEIRYFSNQTSLE